MTTSPEDAATATIELRMYNATGWIAFDDIVFETNPETVTTYYWYNGALTAQTVDEVHTQVFTDHLGSPHTTWTPDTGTIARQLYEPWGGIRHNDTLESSYGYTGQHEDPTGLMHYNARNYDPTIGRFISADTIVPNPTNPQDLNRYSYVGNAPASWTDPSGHCGIFGDGPCPFAEELRGVWEGVKSRAGTTVEYAARVGTRWAGDPGQAAFDLATGTALLEFVSAGEAILADGELLPSEVCGGRAECFVVAWTPMNATTLGHTVVFEGALPAPGTVVHELIHVAQYELMGAVPFLGTYGLEWYVNLITGDPDPYRSISYEVEAYTAQRRFEEAQRILGLEQAARSEHRRTSTGADVGGGYVAY